MPFLLLTSFALATELPPERRLTPSVEARGVALPGDASLGGALVLDSARGASLDTTLRVQASGDWIARSTASYDLLRRWRRFDLDLGLALGGAGDAADRAVWPSLAAGFYWGATWHRDRLHLGYASWRPLGLNARCLGMDERSLTLSFDLGDHLSVFGLASRYRPDLRQDASASGLGAGLRWTF